MNPYTQCFIRANCHKTYMKRFSDEILTMLIKDYTNNMPIEELLAKYHIAYRLLKRIVIEAGLTMRGHKTKINQPKEDKE